MALKKIELTENHLKLISQIKFEAFSFGEDISSKRLGWGIDQWNMFGGTYVMEDVALIIGEYDKFIPGTEDSPSGKRYPSDLEDYMWGIYNDIYSNMEYIIDMVLYYSNKGGLKPGVYKCNTNTMVWDFISK